MKKAHARVEKTPLKGGLFQNELPVHVFFYYFDYRKMVPIQKSIRCKKSQQTYIDDINLHSGCAFLQEEGCAIAE
jgi:hypothetical protein